MSQDTLDVGIVGGGVSGCYAAYRLLNTDDLLSVALYEASDRIGGRIWSYRFPHLPNQVAEMGGIAFSPLHANVFSLCIDELGLDIQEATEFTVNNLQYLRDHRFAFCDYKPKCQPPGYYPNKIPYFLREAEKWRWPIELMLSAFKEAVPEEIGPLFDQLVNLGDDHPDEARKIISQLDCALRNARTIGTNLPLPDCGFWNLLTQHASQEAYDMATMSSGFYSTTQNWNAYNTLLGAFVDFCVPQKWWKLVDGYAALPVKMAQCFAERGGKIHTKTRLRRLEIEGRGSEAVIAMQLETPGACAWTQRARNVILAIPPRSVRLLDPNTFLFRNSEFVDDLSTVTGEPASKLFLTFAEPWWKKVGMPPNQDKNTIEDGQSATDLPMRLCYYLGSEENGKSLLLASFCDSIAVDYWNGYLPHSRFGPSDRAMGADQSHAIPLLMDHPPQAMVHDAVRQLSLVHGFDVPEPLSAKFVNWSADPYGGAFHYWNTHVRSWEVMPRIRRPVSDTNVFLCGEAFSAKQGWVEGAINTAERTLETYFGLPRPTWAPKDYDFGP